MASSDAEMDDSDTGSALTNALGTETLEASSGAYFRCEGLQSDHMVAQLSEGLSYTFSV